MENQIGEKCIAVGGLVYIPVLAYDNCDAVYVPKLFQIRSVGSYSVHLKGYRDVPIEYCYLTEADCVVRCQTLLAIYAMRSATDYPNI